MPFQAYFSPSRAGGWGLEAGCGGGGGMVSISPPPPCSRLSFSIHFFNVGDPPKRGLRKERGVTMGFTNLSSVRGVTVVDGVMTRHHRTPLR